MNQHTLELVQPVETISFQPTKEMPLDVYKYFHRLAYYTELMERVDDNHVLWDEALTSIYSEEAAEAEYVGLQNDWFSIGMEIPKPAFDSFMATP